MSTITLDTSLRSRIPLLVAAGAIVVAGATAATVVALDDSDGGLPPRPAVAEPAAPATTPDPLVTRFGASPGMVGRDDPAVRPLGWPWTAPAQPEDEDPLVTRFGDR